MLFNNMQSAMITTPAVNSINDTPIAIDIFPPSFYAIF
jgi:hypothetical protein